METGGAGGAGGAGEAGGAGGAGGAGAVAQDPHGSLAHGWSVHRGCSCHWFSTNPYGDSGAGLGAAPGSLWCCRAGSTKAAPWQPVCSGAAVPEDSDNPEGEVGAVPVPLPAGAGAAACGGSHPHWPVAPELLCSPERAFGYWWFPVTVIIRFAEQNYTSKFKSILQIRIKPDAKLSS